MNHETNQFFYQSNSRGHKPLASLPPKKQSWWILALPAWLAGSKTHKYRPAKKGAGGQRCSRNHPNPLIHNWPSYCMLLYVLIVPFNRVRDTVKSQAMPEASNSAAEQRCSFSSMKVSKFPLPNVWARVQPPKIESLVLVNPTSSSKEDGVKSFQIWIQKTGWGCSIPSVKSMPSS